MTKIKKTKEKSPPLNKVNLLYGIWKAWIVIKTKYKKAVILLIIGVFQVFSTVSAHAPHDVVKEIVLSPNFSQDNTLYSLERLNLLKSINRGLTWKRLTQGLDSVSALTSVAVDPILSNVLYLSAGKDGVYKSENAGNSWYKINQGLNTFNISKLYAVPAANSGVVFAVSNLRDLYRRESNNWLKVFNNPNPISVIASLSNGQKILTGDQGGNLFLSSDAGFTWSKIYQFANCGEIKTIGTLNSPLLSNRFYVGTSLCGVFRTLDAGKSFLNSSSGITDVDIHAIALSPDFTNDGTLFVSTANQAIFISNNAGLNWKKHSEGLTTDRQGDSNQFSNIGISPNFNNDKTLFLAGFDGLFKSANTGITWRELNTMPRTLIQSIVLSPNYSSDKTLALTTYLGGIYLSKDDGNSWNSVAGNIAYRNSDIVFSPSYPSDGTLFVTMLGKNHIGKTIDYGLTWTTPILLPSSGVPTILAISPNYINDQSLFVATRAAHINRSTDGGTTYSDIYNSENPAASYATSSLVISPNFSVDQTLLIATVNGVHMSNDGGNFWFARGLKNTFGLHAKLAFSTNYAKDHIIFIAGEKGLFRSKDGFSTWHKISNLTRGVDGWVQELAVSPDFKNDKTIIISVKGKGLFKSQDQGWIFQPIGVGLIKANNSIALWEGFPVASSSSIRFSPSYAIDKTIFATSSDWLYRSLNGGKTWEVIVHHSKLGI